ncbi:WXG100 family type VII secretion target [Tsukamurella strandjordii]|uniref:ESAT-6-like protein n=2 Tax=Tsukamurellaceae TaxID=85028 RepID=A0AA90NCY9_9ACTN|nr:WXG100 family type VII secretion target [Tsukamurella strandjordii]MDP0398127.1 WXG100 family type VII secretion target [Tsukamurella strandjordii]
MNTRLQVNPADLRTGGTRFDAQQARIASILNAAERAHTDLQGTWQGSAAEVMQERWDEHLPGVGEHVAKLTEYARLLTSTAADYADTESGSTEEIRAAGEGGVLDLEA